VPHSIDPPLGKAQLGKALIDDPLLDDPLLDNPAWASLTGFHAALAEVRGHAARFLPEVSPFVAVESGSGVAGWRDLHALLGPSVVTLLTGDLDLPPGWEVVERGEGVQLVDAGVDAVPEPQAVRLGAADVPEMLELVALAQPGPFLPRTVELGTYLGWRHEGTLVAMAGERLHPPGWTEISAVATHPDHRGRGLATRLVRAVAHGIRARGDHPFLHTAATNENAIRLYEGLGFVERRRTGFAAVRTPSHQP
jgi:ribosomal protein S18 acetylase RimI-like enzyme